MQRYMLDNNSSGAYSAAALNTADGFDVDFVVRAGQQISLTARIADAYSTTPLSVAIYDQSGLIVPAKQSYGFVSGMGTGSTSEFIASKSGLYTALIKDTTQFTTAQNVTVSAVESGSPALYLKSLHPEPAGAPRFAWTDTVNNQTGTDDGQSYPGPVNYLHWQYLWAGQDGVNVSAKTANVFVSGGPGSDALAAQGGSNVLNGDKGSDFLVGASGMDGGTDTFFVDGRGPTPTWSTAVNFHRGDSVTIWGFNDAQSVFNWTAEDGAAGFQGATIHAQTDGPGTPINASFTFAGISLSDVQSKIAVSIGDLNGLGYLYAKYIG